MTVSAFHGLLDPTLQGIHVPYQWSYATAEARLAATGFGTTDVGKIAIQTNDHTLWILIATTPTWTPVALGDASSLYNPGLYRRLAADVIPQNNSLTDHFLIPSGLSVEGTASNQDDSIAPWARWLSNGAIDAGGGCVSTQQIFRTQWGGELVFLSKVSSLTDVRFFVGTTAEDITQLAIHGLSAPLMSYAVFRYATDLDGTAFWRTVTDSGTGVPTVTVTTVPIAADTPNRLRIRFGNAGASIKFYIDDVFVSEHTATLPAAGTLMRVVSHVKALIAVAKSSSCSRIELYY